MRVALALLLLASPAIARVRQDAIDRPTDTHVELVDGLWHDDTLAPGTGWHLYHYTATADGPIAFQMRAAPGDPGIWSYLRIVDEGEHSQSWAGVANRRTNLCEVIVEVARGHHYQVITTSQQNAVLPPGQRQLARGVYTIAALPVLLP